LISYFQISFTQRGNYLHERWASAAIVGLDGFLRAFLLAPLKTETHLSFSDTVMNYSPMSFKIASMNGCQEPIESNIHRIIFLGVSVDSSSNTMSISRPPYIGWKDIRQYEIWYKNYLDTEFSMVASFKPDQYCWTNGWGAKAFNHHYRLRALRTTILMKPGPTK
jgi:hypothetical protein